MLQLCDHLPRVISLIGPTSIKIWECHNGSIGAVYVGKLPEICLEVREDFKVKHERSIASASLEFAVGKKNLSYMRPR